MNDLPTYTTVHPLYVAGSWFNKNKYHFLIWTLFMANEVAAARVISGKFAPLINYLVHYLINIGFSYTVAFYLLPKALMLKKYLTIKFILVLLFAILVYLSAVLLADQILSYYTNYKFNTANLNIRHYFAIATIWRGVSFMIPGIAYYLFTVYHKSRQQILEQEIWEKKAEIELAESKNAYLKAQINPHFLFNAFNMIYSKSWKSDTPVARAILSLTKIMRYAVKVNQHNEVIEIAQELAQVQHLIEFWELQNQQASPILVNCSPEAAKASFIPLVLLTLVENMLKHGLWEDEHQKGILRVFLSDTSLVVMTSNPIHLAKQDQGFQSGISNISERLTLSYGKLASLVYSVDAINKTFDLKITVST